MRPLSGSKTVELIVPGLEGDTNEFPIAYSPNLNYVFLNSNGWAMGMTAWPTDKIPSEVILSNLMRPILSGF